MADELNLRSLFHRNGTWERVICDGVPYAGGTPFTQYGPADRPGGATKALRCRRRTGHRWILVGGAGLVAAVVAVVAVFALSGDGGGEPTVAAIDTETAQIAETQTVEAQDLKTATATATQAAEATVPNAPTRIVTLTPTSTPTLVPPTATTVPTPTYPAMKKTREGHGAQHIVPITVATMPVAERPPAHRVSLARFCRRG